MLKIVDSLMGTGKTSAAINYMNSNQDKKFIYVAPYLGENQRIVNECPELEFRMPEARKYPSKYTHFKVLMNQGFNICISHELFKKIGSDSYDIIKRQGYTLFLDEAIDLIKIYQLSRDDWRILTEENLIQVDSNGYWQWSGEEYENGLFSDVKRLMQAKTLERISDRETIWKFPADAFRMFDDVFVMTHMFQGSLMDAYCQMEGLEYEFWHVDSQRLLQGYKSDTRTALAELVRIYQGNLNDIGEQRDSLSSTWFRAGRNRGKLSILKNNLYNFFRNIEHSRSIYNMWTCFKEKRRSLSGNGYALGFVPCNARGTNEFRSKKVLAYTPNVFLNPVIKQYMNTHGVNTTDDNYALSSLLQWMWRSRIRDGFEIDIYIPSKRMRNLLRHWLNS